MPAGRLWRGPAGGRSLATRAKDAARNFSDRGSAAWHAPAARWRDEALPVRARLTANCRCERRNAVGAGRPEDSKIAELPLERPYYRPYDGCHDLFGLYGLNHRNYL